MKSKKPLRRRGRERGKPIPAYRAWLRTRPDDITGEYPPCEACHFPRVRLHGDIRNMISMKARRHREQHDVGIKTFCARWGIDDPQALADRVWGEWERAR